MLQPLLKLAKKTEKLSRGEFLEEVRHPHVYLLGGRDLNLYSSFASMETPAPGMAAAAREKGRIMPLVPRLESTLTVGRGAECDLRLDDSAISRRHLRFVNLGDEWLLSDCESTNGTEIDGVRLEPNRPYVLQSGVTIDLARVARMVFVAPADLFEFMRYV